MMGRILFGRVAAMALAVGGFAAMAVQPASAAVLIDSFDTPQGPFVVNSGTPNGGNEVAGGGIIGGAREVWINHAGGPGNSDLNITGGIFFISNDFGTSSTVNIIWDGVGSTGLGGEDLTAGGAMGIAVEVLLSDLGGTLDLTLTDTFAATQSSQIVLPAVGTPTTFTFLFGAFAGVDLTSVDKIQLDISGPGALDVGLDFLETSVPEPGTMALIGLGFVALGVRRRMRKS